MAGKVTDKSRVKKNAAEVEDIDWEEEFAKESNKTSGMQGGEKTTTGVKKRRLGEGAGIKKGEKANKTRFVVNKSMKARARRETLLDKNNKTRQYEQGIAKRNETPKAAVESEKKPVYSDQAKREFKQATGLSANGYLPTTEQNAQKSREANVKRIATEEPKQTMRPGGTYSNPTPTKKTTAAKKEYTDQEKREFKQATGLSTSGYLPSVDQNAKKSTEQNAKKLWSYGKGQRMMTADDKAVNKSNQKAPKPSANVKANVNKASSRGATMDDKTVNNRKNNQNPAWYYGRNNVKSITVRSAKKKG